MTRDTLDLVGLTWALKKGVAVPRPAEQQLLAKGRELVLAADSSGQTSSLFSLYNRRGSRPMDVGMVGLAPRQDRTPAMHRERVPEIALSC